MNGKLFQLSIFILLLVSMVLPTAFANERITLDSSANQQERDELSAGSGEPLGRQLDRVAPVREPAIVTEQIRADGSLRTILEIPATADTYVASGQPNNNFGSDALYLGYSTGGFGAERILLYFPLAGNLPRNVTIQSAEVQLYLSVSDPANDSAMPSVIRRLGSPWGEHSTSWNNAPNWLETGASVFIGSGEGLVSWNITDITRGWHEQRYPNHGVILVGDEQVRQRERVFYARETQTNNFPRLRIVYTTDSENLPLRATVNPLPAYTRNSKFDVSWTNNGAAPLRHYDIRYRFNGGDWVGWQNQVTFTMDGFSAPFDGLYEYEARATDTSGNVEPWNEIEARILVDERPPFVTRRVFLPVVRNR